MTHHVIMPDLGQTVAEGKIVRWLKKLGDKVARGDVLLEVETDKVTMEVESYRAGYLRELLVEEGQMAGAMSPIAVLTDEPEEAYNDSDRIDAGMPADRESSGRATMPALESEPLSPVTVGVVGHPIATPVAKAWAQELGVNLQRLTGTGPDGLITQRDVKDARESHGILKIASPMAALTTRSATEIPHFYVTVDAEVSNALRWRHHWNAAHHELHASVNDVFVRAASLALQDVPRLNVRYRDGKLEERTAADVLLVVAIESGLTLVPVANPSSSSWETYLPGIQRALEGVRQHGMVKSAGEAPVLAISNLGMFGVKQFTAIIPPECSAVLAIGAIREEVIVQNKQMRIGEVCSLTLSSDHRMIDGITAAKFLERVQAHLNSL
ncbi:MAG: dihydrolipoamide acetyltransferase family protein [Terriglobia bacterium]